MASKCVGASTATTSGVEGVVGVAFMDRRGVRTRETIDTAAMSESNARKTTLTPMSEISAPLVIEGSNGSSPFRAGGSRSRPARSRLVAPRAHFSAFPGLCLRAPASGEGYRGSTGRREAFPAFARFERWIRGRDAGLVAGLECATDLVGEVGQGLAHRADGIGRPRTLGGDPERGPPGQVGLGFVLPA